MQVLEHILNNSLEAIIAAGEAEGRIDISGDIIDEDPDQIVLKIKDNGIGFDPAHLTKMFQREFTTKEEKSAGIGLHWCATTINAMGGKILIENNRDGKGALVSLQLPRFRDLD